MMQTVQAYWKRSAGWVIGLVRKHEADPFLRSQINIIALQVCFVVLVLGFVAISLLIINRELSDTVLQSIPRNGVSLRTSVLLSAVISKLYVIRLQNFTGIALLVLFATAVWGYIVARVSLAPTRNALSAQKQFIGNIAHELRTPLAILKTNTEIALLDHGIRDDLRETLTSNVEEIDRISEIINNLLSISTLVNPGRIEFSECDVGVIISDIVAKFSPLAKAKNQSLVVRKSPDLLVWGNAAALQQIVSNIFKNALKYTPSKGTITLTVTHLPVGMIEIVIEDSGIGIERMDLFRIFEPFYRVDPSRSRGQGGTGLGLAIVSELVKLHRGRITVKSTLGRGTRVVVLLPAARIQKTNGPESRANLDEIAVDFLP